MATVFVGLSGGVDSAVSAALLKEAGHSVVGAFIKIWRPEFIECPWQKDRLDAMRVCAHLGIPFREIDLSDEYKKTVIDDMVSNYARGITPNPDVLCNRHIKFGAFKEWALGEGADMIATGHYARIQISDVGLTKSHMPKSRMLLRGKDAGKDQSYFLWRLTEEDLSRTLFPVGGYTKPEVRALAKKFDLPVARKPDSQGLCFVGDVSMRDFLSRYLPLEKGAVLDESGKKIGEHDGAALYTPGERHGFRIEARSSHEDARYVIAIDTKANTITVSHDKEKAMKDEAALIDANWIGEQPAFPFTCVAQARYHETPIGCTVTEEGGSRAIFERPHLAPPGQSLVFYEGERLRGGAVIAG
ncbi:tRNA 2-thiouridine(34) synthase MnmA [Candidatus Kaiserbacteria bacterium RIFCSPHIGHO2_01_FULL_56_24]|uniref:tRNA-specific 2-thiouridylase MnmA n=1 Tax=Candidatus Kaiserbacteria bacterium RIFCSPHIGHO2_01_FULL_56_24 TaxID=1798487 RepID=A0A1F6DF22_9BACT|nr:MAG: tRNA 2-thiouridine(34) synthase MnmA [Candidatus Kaiserbacteria bacterium RIFCSPHIGHO2_01_FULL_56_24]